LSYQSGQIHQASPKWEQMIVAIQNENNDHRYII
jgi:hypothetical protein